MLIYILVLNNDQSIQPLIVPEKHIEDSTTYKSYDKPSAHTSAKKITEKSPIQINNISLRPSNKEDSLSEKIYNEKLKPSSRISYRIMHPSEKVFTSKCPTVSNNNFYTIIELDIKEDVMDEKGMIFVEHYIKTKKDTIRKDSIYTKLSTDKDGFFTTQLSTEYYRPQKGLQRIKTKNHGAKGKYSIKYGFMFNIDNTRADVAEQTCFYDL